MSDAPRHRWRFFRAGGFDQVQLHTADDLRDLPHLDQKLWMALACPTRGLEIDPKTLDLIDADHDGRIRAPEVIAATQWACNVLLDPALLTARGDSLPLAALDTNTPEGKTLHASARQILKDLGKPEAADISLADVANTAAIFAQTRFNGDGIIPADATDDPALAAILKDIIATQPPQTDRSGKPGVSGATADAFFADVAAAVAWLEKPTLDLGILPLADATPAAHAALQAVRAKIDDYFARTRLAAYDPRAVPALNRPESEYAALADQSLSPSVAEAANFPLARIEPDRPLPLATGINPAWSAPIARFVEAAVVPILGTRTELTAGDYATIVNRLAAYGAWQAARAGASVENLGLPRLKEILAANARPAIAALIDQDNALKPEADAIANVEKLLRFRRDLHTLLINFVNFRAFYSRKEKAIFQAGTLYLDGRACQLCVRVDDMARHGLLAHLARTYLAYVECTRKATGEKMTIAAAFTNGDSDNLMVGRNGVFYDRAGNDYDATITKIVDHPISIRQAFWAPYKRAVRWIEDQIAKRAAAADAQSTDRLIGAASSAEEAARTGKPPGTPKIDIGIVAALGVAVGGITAALGMLLQAFFGLGFWMPLGVVGLVLLISGPAMIIAWLKLRQRNLGPILDANGWAVNARAKINIPFGRSLTDTAALPPGARRDLVDPYAEKSTFWIKAGILAALLALLGVLWYFGLVDKAFPNVLPKSPYTLRQEEQARKAVPVPVPVPATLPATAPATTQPPA